MERSAELIGIFPATQAPTPRGAENGPVGAVLEDGLEEHRGSRVMQQPEDSEGHTAQGLEGQDHVAVVAGWVCSRRSVR